ncbi:hypothetical protein KY329_00200 [Candidatus Woesearchaeota archaeon]|nr:hypothetical protein [Candidatus Woesearchaeota archaeon]
MKKIIILLVILTVITACGGPVCGNSEVEKGETSANCCLDVGCIGGQTCVDNVCVDPKCGECEHLVKHECVAYACCNDSECSTEEKCANHECQKVICGSCEYLDDRECKALPCCDDADCDDGKPETIDLCKYPSTKSAECTHEQANDCEADADCDDNDVSTSDSCSSATPRKCRNIPITKCIDNDDYCPDDCTYSDDNDCEETVTDCDDIDCFYDALDDDCHLAELTWTTEDYNSTHEVDITTYMEIIKKTTEDECKVYFKTKDLELAFTADYIDDLKDDFNYTTAEVQELEDDAQDDADYVVGYDWTCYFDNTNDLKAVLNDWEDGDYGFTEFENYDCDGDYF